MGSTWKRAAGTTALVAVLAVAMAGCSGSAVRNASPTAAPSVDAAAAAAWANASTCPPNAQVLHEMAYSGGGPHARPGTDQHLAPAGDVVAVMRCDTDASVSGANGVTRTVLLDAQPVSWFADGDHFPTVFRPMLNGPTGYAVVLHYSSGPEVVVSTWEPKDGTRVSSNGVIRCTSTMSGAAASTICRPEEGGASFVPASTSPAAGAPPVDCAPSKGHVVPTAAPTPRPGTGEHIAPASGLVVLASCSMAGGQAQLWGAAARAEVKDDAQPFTVGYQGACVGLEPNCNGLRVDTYLGYTSGPQVDVTAWLTAEVAPTVGALAPIGGGTTYGGAVTNGVIGCVAAVKGGIDPGFDPRPPPVRACFPLAQVTSAPSPLPTTTIEPAP